ncbi:hypothetical protein CL633_00290 [bacterium]|nr:hypothetical protein [bacterium]
MKKAYIILIIIFSFILIIGAIYWSWSKKSLKEIFLLPSQDQYNNQNEVLVGYGWSVKDNLVQAVEEASLTALKNFQPDSIPEYVILFSTVGHDSEKLLKQVRNFFPGSKLIGGTSMYGVYTRDGYHLGEKGSLSIMAVSSDKIDFGVGGADITKKQTAKQAGAKAVTNAIKDAGKKIAEKPKLVYLVGSFGNEEGIIAGIESVIGKDIPIVGGSAFDDDASGKWKQFLNDKAYQNGIGLTVFYTDLKVGWAYEAGYDLTGNTGVITKAKDRTIYEIDNKLALDVYDEWTNGLVSKISKDSSAETLVEIEQTALNPLAKIKGGKNELHYLTMHPYLWNLKERSISLGVNVSPGEEIALVHGTWETNLNHSKSTPDKAMKSQNIKKGRAYFAIYSYCLGKMLTIPAEERNKVPLMVNNVLGHIPFIGANTGGEQGLLKGVGNEHGGLVNDIIIFAPAE